MAGRYVCIHGHFYQPPRENPWLGAVELQDSAYPFHDWNERITEECYAPNTASRLLGPEGKIIDIVNNYSRISFNFGPTLFSWLESQSPAVYHGVIEADRISQERFSGHGSAMAQVYNHMIMPLSGEDDMRTQVLWGLKDFTGRFGRSPEGMWLPETAADTQTLEVLSSCGISFTVLSPHQAKRVRPVGADGKWKDVSGGKVNTQTPYLINLPSGKTLNIFFYDGHIAHEVSFGGLLKSGEDFAERLVAGFSHERPYDRLVHIATDGENYGHHHRHGDMALAYCLNLIESEGLAKLTNYAEFLDKHPPEHEVEIQEKSSWSCVHGVERWRADCGCTTGTHDDWHQKWRAPLRDAMDRLRDRLGEYYETKASEFLADPWKARDEYIDVILERNPESIDRFLSVHAKPSFRKKDLVSTLKLLEMQRNAMLMYTSCGWFFEDISGIETVQALQYAAHAIQYAVELGAAGVEEDFMGLLKKAPSNVLADGAAVYEKYVKPATVNLLRVGAHYAISSIFEGYSENIRIFCYSGKADIYNKNEVGKTKLVTGKATLKSDITLETKELTFGALYLGEQSINAGVAEFRDEKSFMTVSEELNEPFRIGDTAGVIRRMDSHFGPNIYSIWHLFRDEQRKIINQLLEVTYEGIEASYRHIYEDNFWMMNFLSGLHMPLPRPLEVAASYIVNLDIERILTAKGDVDIKRLEDGIDLVNRWSLNMEKSTLEYLVSIRINSMMQALADDPGNIGLMERVENTLELIGGLKITPDLWEAQNIYFNMGKLHYAGFKSGAAGAGGLVEGISPQRWLDVFGRLGHFLGVRVE